MSQVLQENAGKFAQIMVGWDGVKDSDGNSVAFSEDLLKKQVKGPNGTFLSAALWVAINEIRYGARLGN